MTKNNTFFPLLFSTFLLIPIISWSQSDGLIGYYAFSGSAIDSSENQNHGAAVDATLTNDLNDNPACAYHFNGSTSYITMGTDESLEIDTAISISAWFLAKDAGSPSSGGIIVNKEGEYSLARFADGSIRWALAFNGIWDNHINTNVEVPLNQPTHIALTYSMAEGELKVYLNCELVFSESHSSPVGDYTPDQNELRVGARQFLPQFFDGIIDEVKIYNRTLTLGEIQENCFVTSQAIVESLKNKINIYPNPTNGPLFIDNQSVEQLTFKINDSTGKVISSGKVNKDNPDLKGFAQGIYFISIFNKNNKLLSINKIIKLPNRA